MVAEKQKKGTQEGTFDLRILDYSISNGLLSQKDYENYLKSLPDEEGNYEFVQVKEEEEEESLDSTESFEENVAE